MIKKISGPKEKQLISKETEEKNLQLKLLSLDVEKVAQPILKQDLIYPETPLKERTIAKKARGENFKKFIP